MVNKDDQTQSYCTALVLIKLAPKLLELIIYNLLLVTYFNNPPSGNVRWVGFQLYKTTVPHRQAFLSSIWFLGHCLFHRIPPFLSRKSQTLTNVSPSLSPSIDTPRTKSW